MDFVDFEAASRGKDIGLLFPGWTAGERVAFFSPHDDDVALGAGYLILAVTAAGGAAHVLIFSRGDAGYSAIQDKETIVAKRRSEAVAAYGLLGAPAGNIHFFDLPDLSLMTYVNRQVPGAAGVLDELLRLLRGLRVSRVVLPNPNLENWDHTAVFNLGVYGAPQAGDPILADLGQPSPIRTYLAYAVWSDFEAARRESTPGADAGILATQDEEVRVRKALAAFASQARVMAATVAHERDKRRFEGHFLELYRRVDLRCSIDYQPYFDLIGKMKTRS